MSNTINSDDSVIECVSINGIVVDLRDVSHNLRQQWHQAARAVGRHARANDQMKAVGQKILDEQLPNLAIKYAPRARGLRNVVEKMRERS